MDYAKQLQAEVQGAHAVFHEFALLLSRVTDDAFFFFFEGEEDPSFYMGHIHPRLAGRKSFSFICYGRSEVLKAHELVQQDGRKSASSLFFVDKDHTSICDKSTRPPGGSIFQTSTYSIENYLVCQIVFRRYWVERLHLPDADDRLERKMTLFHDLHSEFVKRSRLLMSAVLIGRGVDGRTPIKLNLNNIQLDKVLRFDYEQKQCRFMPGAAKHFLASSNLSSSGIKISSKELRFVYRTHLMGEDPKSFVRGKFELWFFWKFLMETSRQLSDRNVALQPGQKRATPRVQLTLSSCLESIAPLCPCPVELTKFLAERIGE